MRILKRAKRYVVSCLSFNEQTAAQAHLDYIPYILSRDIWGDVGNLDISRNNGVPHRVRMRLTHHQVPAKFFRGLHARFVPISAQHLWRHPLLVPHRVEEERGRLDRREGRCRRDGCPDKGRFFAEGREGG